MLATSHKHCIFVFRKYGVMIKSMTGFGKSAATAGQRVITIEIRALNSKQLDVSTRIPALLREKEGEIRSEIARSLERGKVDFIITVENTAEAAVNGINKALAKKYFEEISQLASEFGLKPGTEVLPEILNMPDVMTGNRDSLPDDDWALVRAAIGDAIVRTNQFREEEGQLLGKDMLARIELIMNLLKQVEPFEKSRIVNLRERFERNKDEFIETSGTKEKFDENRFEQEIFWYLEKLDITEEKLRLGKHCNYFAESLASDESNGRKLGFISQEIGREINTLGSKAYDADMQRIVVQMKDELEKIKEQIGNVL